MSAILLEVKELKTYFYTRRGVFKAVDGVSFSVEEGEVLGLIGESACGKTITGLSILRLVPQPAGRIVSGEILFKGEDLLKKSEREMRRLRGGKLSMIMQDPMTSLNPVFSIGSQIGEAISLHQKVNGKTLWHRVREILRLVKIPSPEMRMHDFPHQMSGGMRQRVAGAIAFSCQPSLLIADEPTTSLDVTIQAQYLELLKEIQEKLGMSIILITHDFGIVASKCDRAAVMYAGKIVETASVQTLFHHHVHPYTKGLMDSLPRLEQETARLVTIEGEPPSLLSLPNGCAFTPRCPVVMKRCQEEYPPEICISRGHFVSCWRAR
jgi:peptide/nickel transport system ATP-binding protein/oligopeptide transport system ATP-binding protein